MRIVGKMRMDLSDKRNNSRGGPGMTRLGHSVPKINPWALRPTLGGPLVALNGGTVRHHICPRHHLYPIAQQVSPARPRRPSALVGLWTPPAIEEFQRPPRWDRATPAFERVSKCGALVDSVWTHGGWYMS